VHDQDKVTGSLTAHRNSDTAAARVLCVLQDYPSFDRCVVIIVYLLQTLLVDISGDVYRSDQRLGRNQRMGRCCVRHRIGPSEVSVDLVRLLQSTVRDNTISKPIMALDTTAHEHCVQDKFKSSPDQRSPSADTAGDPLSTLQTSRSGRWACLA